MLIEWASDVNKIVIDDATLTLGENARVEDTLENGDKRTRLSLSNPPDTYSFSMDFDWLKKDANGFTEKDRFIAWYKYKHKFGTNPFRFPTIILGSENVLGDSYYTITSLSSGKKYGHSVRFQVTMREYIATQIDSAFVSGIKNLTSKRVGIKTVITAKLQNMPLTFELSEFTLKVDEWQSRDVSGNDVYNDISITGLEKTFDNVKNQIEFKFDTPTQTALTARVAWGAVEWKVSL